ncbi:hypothetical protein ACI2S3_20135 [Ralstonia nicotianae]|uniref:Uncharacterized protein n=1 Tax=Ralstonia solanacearum TaxID=305 RepID=A0A0S4VLG8_RALSL|nr:MULTISPECIES: hypothetical protein [Ralstonia solanacearum species complex]CUV35246.1 conserved exported protein of unknown function [Ralstonia solanacearum]
MKRLIPTAALFVATATPAQTAPPTPSAVLSHIASAGARQTLLASYDTPQWNAILKGIASGDDDWLRVYEALRRVADAAAGEDLGDAIHDALPQRPFEVLSLLGAESGATPQQLCTFTFESRRPAEGVGAYLGRLGQALDRASSTTQREVASACRLGIEATRKAFPER